MQDNCPQLSLSPATFTTAASAALSAAGITLSPSDQTFNPYSSEAAFFIGAFIFEVWSEELLLCKCHHETQERNKMMFFVGCGCDRIQGGCAGVAGQRNG